MVVGSMRSILKLRKRGAILSVMTPPSVRRYEATASELATRAASKSNLFEHRRRQVRGEGMLKRCHNINALATVQPV